MFSLASVCAPGLLTSTCFHWHQFVPLVHQHQHFHWHQFVPLVHFSTTRGMLVKVIMNLVTGIILPTVHFSITRGMLVKVITNMVTGILPTVQISTTRGMLVIIIKLVTILPTVMFRLGILLNLVTTAITTSMIFNFLYLAALSCLLRREFMACK